jgi:universal stress protein A
MSQYRHILLVVDLNDDAAILGRHAADFARTFGAKIDLLHVLEFVPVEPMGETLMPAVQIEEELLARARKRLEQLAEELQLGDASLFVEPGSIKTEIIRVARERNVDLIMLGCRERHGMSILVNLTEDTVLHGAHCDVLAVRLHGARS